MPIDELGDQSDRTHTNESLRLERERSDQALEERLSTINEAADTVIIRARARARDVLARARARAEDVLTAALASSSLQTKRERVVAAQVLQAEQTEAETRLRAELVAHLEHFAVERDDTDSNLQTERVRSDDVLAKRDEVLGTVSHELRNMLHSMIGFAELIELEMAGKTETEKRVIAQARCIQRSGARMDRLIGDLVDVASIESGVLMMTRELGDIGTVIAEAVEAFADQAMASGISVSWTLVGPVPATLFDPARVLQVLVNLLSNALKFTPRDGKVAVRVERVGGDARFCVSDTGMGIPDDKLELVFDRFWQGTRDDRRGAGLGLYISKRIVLAHGGKIWVESTREGGSSFFFTLPCVDSPSTSSV